MDAGSPSGSHQRIARRPVARASTDASPTPVQPSSPRAPAAVDRPRSRTVSTSLSSRPGRRTGTRELFSQASRSLSNLTQHFESAEPQDCRDVPPPYAESAGTNTLPTPDVKRSHADSISSVTSQDLSAFALVQGNESHQLHEKVHWGVSGDEIDPSNGRTVLMEAAATRRTSVVDVLLHADSRLYHRDLEGNSALHYAALRGDATICDKLLTAGARVEEYNRYGQTPISLAARAGHTGAVDCLLNSWTTQRGTSSALTKGYLEALKSGNVETVGVFIERHIKPKKIKESVLCAAAGGSVPVLDYILAQKCNLKERSADGWSALHFAAEQGHIAMIEKLLAHGLPWKGQTKKAGETALAVAIRHGQIATANALILHKDAKVNRYDNDRVTPLHHAARIGDLELMSTLFNAGAKTDVHSKYGWGLMHAAAAYGHAHLVAELITRGASIEEKLTEAEFEPPKKTNEAARRGYWAEIRWPHTSARPLHLSLEFGHDEVANILIAAGAKIEAADGKGWRALHHASFGARPAIVELLLSRGASPHATTEDNNTPLTLGFRSYGLTGSEEDKIRVWELLQGAMNVTKKTRLQQFTAFMHGSGAGRQVERRNKIWHTAELAAALHLEDQAEERPDEEDDTDLTPGTDEQRWDDVGSQGTALFDSQTTVIGDTKSPK